MKKILENFYKLSFVAIAACLVCTTGLHAAAVRQGPAYANTKMNRTGARAPVATNISTTPTVAEKPEEPVVETVAEPEPEPVIVVDNKTSKFDEVFTDLGTKTTDTTSADLAERVRRQRALLDGAANAGLKDGGPSGITGANACDSTLRKCMAEKCGSDFTKCAKDSTAIWGDKIDSCRRKTKCTGHEYAVFAPEILADRDLNERMSYYQSVLSCGNKYNSCVFAECGSKLEKCLSKSDGDRAISKCESIAKECKEQDSGLAARVMTVFGNLRTVATAQVKKDEQRLYELRDLMRTQCNRFGAMFDERTLDCVYTVNFFAGDDNTTPKASKKLYAGDTFQCNTNWFGIDVTTFKENAYRRTRSQTSASSAMLGAGVGVAAGLLSSGAIGRALETQKAEKQAKQECENSGFTWEKGACNQEKPLQKKEEESKDKFLDETDETETETQETEIPTDETADNADEISDKRTPQSALKSVLDKSGSTAIINDATECVQYRDESSCGEHADKCYWQSKGCFALSSKTDEYTTDIAPEVESESEVSTSANTAQSSGSCNFNEWEQNLVIDKPIDLSGCSAVQIASNKSRLELACSGNNSILFLRKDNKTVSEHQVTPVTENNIFTCKYTRWFDIKDVNGKIAEIEKWDSETQPTQQDCASTCAKIKSVTDPAKNTVEFPGNKQCLKVCVPEVRKSCDGLIEKPYGQSVISDIARIIYKVDGKKLTYQCQFHYKSAKDLLNDDKLMSKIEQASHTGLSYSGASNNGKQPQTKFDPSVNGIELWYNDISGETKQMTYQPNGYWMVRLPDYTTIEGVTACSSLPGSNGAAASDQQKVSNDTVIEGIRYNGKYCYCRIIKPETHSSGMYSLWTQLYVPDSSYECAQNCAKTCGTWIKDSPSVRKAMFKTLTAEDKVPKAQTTKKDSSNQSNNTNTTNNKTASTTALDPEVNGTKAYYNNISGKNSQMLSRRSGYWAVDFPNNVSLSGLTACSSLPGSNGAAASDQQKVSNDSNVYDTDNPNGKYCYCRIMGTGSRYSLWTQIDTHSSKSECAQECTKNCSTWIKDSPSVRKAMFKTLTAEDKVPKPTKKLDPNSKMVIHWYNDISGQHMDQKWGYGYGVWGGTFENGIKIQGSAACSTLKGEKNGALATNNQMVQSQYTSKQTSYPNGGYCYCRITSPQYSQWMFLDKNYDNNVNCANDCANDCVSAVGGLADIRKTLFNTLTKEDKLPEPKAKKGPNTSTKLKPNVDGIEMNYIGINTTFSDLSASQKDRWPLAYGSRPGSWFVVFPDKVSVRGVGVCSSLKGTKKGAVATSQNQVSKAYNAVTEPTNSPEGQYCYCKTASSGDKSRWLYVNDELAKDKCADNCPMHCAQALMKDANFRKAVINNPG